MFYEIGLIFTNGIDKNGLDNLMDLNVNKKSESETIQISKSDIGHPLLLVASFTLTELNDSYITIPVLNIKYKP